MNICPKCLKNVAFAEKVIALNEIWHPQCFICENCNKRLSSSTVSDHDGKPFCSNCHKKLFGI